MRRVFYTSECIKALPIQTIGKIVGADSKFDSDSMCRVFVIRPRYIKLEVRMGYGMKCFVKIHLTSDRFCLTGTVSLRQTKKFMQSMMVEQIRLLNLRQSVMVPKRGKPSGGHKRSKKAFTILFST